MNSGVNDRYGDMYKWNVRFSVGYDSTSFFTGLSIAVDSNYYPMEDASIAQSSGYAEMFGGVRF